MTEQDKAKTNNSPENKPKISIVDRRHWVDEEDEEGEITEPEERLPTYVEQLKKEAEEKDKKLRDYISAYKEKNAENDDFRARLQKDNEGRLDQFKANIFSRLVPVLDNLKRASDAAKQNADFDSLKQGIEMVISHFSRELENNDVKMIDTKNRAFDPKTDEAFMTVTTEDPSQDNMILEELEPGYRYKDKLIKAAKVKIGKLKS